MSNIGDMIDRAAKCSKCGGSIGCGCWVPCLCGWLKERGTPGCHRCTSVKWTHTWAGLYTAKAGGLPLRVYRRGIHWTYSTIADRIEWESDLRAGAAKTAMAHAVAHAWKWSEESPWRSKKRSPQPWSPS